MTDALWEVTKKRFELMPNNMRISIGGAGVLDKKAIIDHLENRDEIGELFVKMQLNYLRLFKKEVEFKNE
jgi:hypothetical protein